MKLKLLIITLIFLLAIPNVNAIQINNEVSFITSETGSNYYIDTQFNCTNITIYPSSLNIDGGNITTYSNINMSMENLMNETYIHFTNNATITNLTIEAGFANFTITDDVEYALYYQVNDTQYDSVTATSQIIFNSIPAGSWHINGVPPTIVTWSNNKTSDASQDITIDITESIEFNATADKTVTTWSWFKDTVDQVNNFYNYIVSWITGGSKIVEVNATNVNGTSNTIQWNVTVSILPPQNLISTPDIDHIHFDWDDYTGATLFNISELEESAPYINTSIVLDGFADSVFNDSSHGFIISTPNQISPSNYETVHWFRNDTHLIGHADGFDADGLSNDDSFRIGIDNTGNGLTTDDRKFILSESGTVTAKRWSGSAWLPQSTSSEGMVVNAGGGGAISYEMIIPLSEMSGFVNGVTAKFFMERRDSSQNPDVSTFFPETLINTTDASIWATTKLTVGEEYVYIGNSTLSEYGVTNLTGFTWYKHRFIAINGVDESTPIYSTDITLDLPKYTVSGYIKDIDGLPIVNATVYAQNGVVTESDITNASGYYIGKHFHNGSYTIYANATGYNINSTPITVAGINLTNINLTLFLSTQQINVTNLTVTPITIKEGQTSTITVDANETSGSITAVTVTIADSTYLMSATTGDTWSYTWTAPQNAPHKYFITQVAATGLYSTNTTTQSAYIDVVSATGSGGFGSGGFSRPPLPDVDISEMLDEIVDEAVDEVTILDDVVSTIINTTGRVKNILVSKEIALIGVKYTVGEYSTTKEFAKPEALTCESTDPIVSCGVMNGVLTIIVIPTTDDSKLYQLTDTYVQITNKDGSTYHLPVSLSLINLMWYIELNIDTGIKNPYIVADGTNTDKTGGIRGWWLTIIIGIFMIWAVRKYK